MRAVLMRMLEVERKMRSLMPQIQLNEATTAMTNTITGIITITNMNTDTTITNTTTTTTDTITDLCTSGGTSMVANITVRGDTTDSSTSTNTITDTMSTVDTTEVITVVITVAVDTALVDTVVADTVAADTVVVELVVELVAELVVADTVVVDTEVAVMGREASYSHYQRGISRTTPVAQEDLACPRHTDIQSPTQDLQPWDSLVTLTRLHPWKLQALTTTPVGRASMLGDQFTEGHQVSMAESDLEVATEDQEDSGVSEDTK